MFSKKFESDIIGIQEISFPVFNLDIFEPLLNFNKYHNDIYIEKIEKISDFSFIIYLKYQGFKEDWIDKLMLYYNKQVKEGKNEQKSKKEVEAMYLKYILYF